MENNKQKVMKNPFKMLGSYLGMVAGAIGAYFSFAFIFYLAENGKFITIAFLIPVAPLILGFLAGWGVEVAIRKLIIK